MGRRIDEWLSFFRFLRTTKPKYSFEVYIFHIMLSFAGGVFVILGETRLCMLVCVVLGFSCCIHWWRIRRVVKRQQAWIGRMTSEMDQAVAVYEQQCASRHEPPDLDVITRLCKDIEWAWLERTIPRVGLPLVNYERAMDATHQEPPNPADLAQLREDVERAREREAAGE